MSFFAEPPLERTSKVVEDGRAAEEEVLVDDTASPSRQETDAAREVDPQARDKAEKDARRLDERYQPPPST